MRFRKIHGAGNDFVLLSDPAPKARRTGQRRPSASVPGEPA
jgi:diaminopimelate epimerase